MIINLGDQNIDLFLEKNKEKKVSIFIISELQNMNLLKMFLREEELEQIIKNNYKIVGKIY